MGTRKRNLVKVLCFVLVFNNFLVDITKGGGLSPTLP